MANTLRVLYVDDETDLLDIGRIFLEQSGDFTVTTAISAPDAIRLLEQEQFDAIISDYQMPGMDGIKFLIEVRTIFGQIPFILFTGKGREEVVIQAINNGADFYIQKGGDPTAQFAELSHKVRMATARKMADDSLQEEQQFSKLMLDSLPGIFYLYTYPEHQLTRWNKQHETLLGYTADEMKGRLASDWHPPELKNAVLKATKEVMERGHSSVESNLIAKDGHTIPFFLTGVRFEAHGRLYYMGIGIDITERKLAEEAARASHDQLTKSEADLRIHQVELEMQGEELRKSKIALEESRDKFIDLYDFAPVGYLTLNDAALITDVNLTGAKLLGVERKKLLMARFRKFVVQPDLDIWDRYFLHVMDLGEKQTCMLTLRRRDGSMFPARLESIRSGDRDVATTVRVAITDISDMREVEEILRESEEKLRATIGQSMDGILITDGDFNIIEWNATQTTIYGYTREEMLGKPLWEFQFATMPKEQKSSGLLEKMKRRMLDHRSSPDSVWMNSLHDYTVPCGDGPCKTVQISTFPIVFRDSVLFGSISRDISETKRAEEKLLVNEQKFRDIFENSVVGLFQTAPGGRMINVNEAFAHMYGFSDAAEMLAADLDVGSPPYANPEDRQKVLHILAEKGKVESYEAPHLKRDGTHFWVSITARTIRNTEGNVLLYEGTIIDITERKQSEETIRHALAEKEVLLREVHHRVKNNLAAIISLIGLQIAALPDPVVLSQLRDLETRIRCMGLVHESLCRSKDLARINVASYTENLTRLLFQVYGTGANVRCRIEMGDVTMPIETATPCGLVMNEIVTNSLKYAFPTTFSCGEIHGEPCIIVLTLQREGSDYLLCVSDNGIGIQGGTDATVHHSLGMFLIRLIVEHQLRGSLDISTTSGTAYTIRFPESAATGQNTDE